MINRPTLTRRDGLKALAGVGALGAIGAATFAAAGQQNGQRTLEWKGHGEEHATIDCAEDKEGTWHCILTPGGPRTIEEGAELTVTFADQATKSVTGFRPGGMRGAVHFLVSKQGGGEFVDAAVTFTGGSDRSVLTISGAFCEGVPPEFEPLVVTADCVKYRGQIMVENPNDVAVTVTVTGPDDYEQTQEVAAGGTIAFDDLADGVYELTTDPEEVGLDQPTVEIVCTFEEQTPLSVSWRCVEGRGQITVSNPNMVTVTATVTGPDDYEEVHGLERGQTVYLADLDDGEYSIAVDPAVGADPDTLQVDCS